MLPREHGAYGQLIFPLVSALALGRPGVAAFAWAAAAVCAFIAHEPLLVLLGQRGRRAAREERARAIRWFAAFAGASAVFGALAMGAMTPAARSVIPVAVASAVLVAVVVFAGRQHTVTGEVLAAVALSSLAWPAALAAGAEPVQALTCVATFAVAFATATIAVHAVIARTQKPPAVQARTMAVIASAAGPLILWSTAEAGLLLAVAPLGALPMAGLSGALAIISPSARRLRTVGWALVATSAATAALIVGGIRIAS